MDEQSLLEENDVQVHWSEGGHPDDVLSGLGCVGCLGTDPYLEAAIQSSVATAKIAKSFTKPEPGSQPVWFSHVDEALKAVQKGLAQHSKAVQQQTALELMKRQQQGQQNYLPQKVVEKVRREQTGWSTETKVLVGVGAGLLGLAFLMAVTRKPKRAASVSIPALPAPAL